MDITDPMVRMYSHITDLGQMLIHMIIIATEALRTVTATAIIGLISTPADHILPAGIHLLHTTPIIPMGARYTTSITTISPS